MPNTEYKKGKVGDLVHFICEAYKLEEKEVRANLIVNFPELTDKSLCANCKASMKIDLYEPDILDALLLLSMGRAVRENVRKGVPFTEANIVHVPTLPTTDAIRHRTTRCSYLNYIKQPDHIRNSGNWLITQWGWALLRGDAVPKTVRYFRGELVDRGEGTVTLSQMFQVHTDKVQAALARRGEYKNDLRSHFSDYNPGEWRGFGGFSEGSLLN